MKLIHSYRVKNNSRKKKRALINYGETQVAFYTGNWTLGREK